MELPIVNQPRPSTGDDAIRAARRCRMDLSRALGEEFSAGGAFAFSSIELPSVAIANCVELDRPLTSERLAQIETDFAERQARCLRWTLPTADPFLAERGALARQIAVLRLNRSTRSVNPSAHMVLQARAALPKVEALMSNRFLGRADYVVAGLLHIDDPQDEWLIAIENGQAVAMSAVLISGDAGLLHDIYAASAGIAAMPNLLDRSIEFAGRAGLRHVLALAEVGDTAVLEAAGFQQVGAWVEHEFAPTNQSAA